MGCILLRKCLLNQLLKDFFSFNSWGLFFFSSFFFFLFSERRSVTFYNHCNKCEHYEDIWRQVNNLSSNFPSHFLHRLACILTHLSPSSHSWTQICAHAGFSILQKILCSVLLICHGHPSLCSQISPAKFIFLHYKDSQFEQGKWDYFSLGISDWSLRSYAYKGGDAK